MKYRYMILLVTGLVVISTVYIYPVLSKKRTVRRMQVLPAHQLTTFVQQFEALVDSVEADLPVASHKRALDIFKRWGPYKIDQDDLKQRLSYIEGLIEDDKGVDGYYAIKDVLDVIKIPLGIKSWWDVTDARTLELPQF